MMDRHKYDYRSFDGGLTHEEQDQDLKNIDFKKLNQFEFFEKPFELNEYKKVLNPN